MSKKALESFEKRRLSLSSLESMLGELLPSASSKGLGRRGRSAYAITAAESERRNLQAYPDLPEDEYDTALENAMESKGIYFMEGHIIIARCKIFLYE